MRKYENVDVIAALGAVMEINTEHYKSDFQYDIEMFQKGAATPDGDLNRLLWLSRPNGTECFRERDAYVKEIHSHNAWCYYANTKDTILAYAVEITGMEGGKVKGNLYELDYQKHVKQLKQDAQPPTAITFFRKDDTEQRIPFDEYKNSSNATLINKYGKVERLRYEVADESSIRQAMKQAKADRQNTRPPCSSCETAAASRQSGCSLPRARPQPPPNRRQRIQNL